MRRFIALLAASLLVLSLAGSATAAPADKGGDHKVTVCHATGSEKNPWILITVNMAATNGRGHDIHQGDADLFPATSLDDCYGIDGG